MTTFSRLFGRARAGFGGLALVLSRGKALAPCIVGFENVLYLKAVHPAPPEIRGKSAGHGFVPYWGEGMATASFGTGFATRREPCQTGPNAFSVRGRSDGGHR
ncbi:hypothetical protein MES4922_20315 [Mesorhizobium ventifaucium]|uniref:Uncharacterized protein n=1 Tax=Mesorhizobium ventifaucium TaxID=666020 RepID=A0ABM9DS01_9HYPH|nr:hypothetical protein MES4922_20315 [Mesorhizobium ventifaucium]